MYQSYEDCKSASAARLLPLLLLQAQGQLLQAQRLADWYTIYIYIYIYTYIHVYTYIYIYIERERDIHTHMYKTRLSTAALFRGDF